MSNRSNPSGPSLARLLAVRDVLTYSFDLDLLDEPRQPLGFGLTACESRVFAVDATGGSYACCGTDLEIGTGFHVDLTGRLVVLGQGLAETVGMVVVLPYFRELCQQSSASSELLERAASLEAEVRADVAELDAARHWLRDQLGLPLPADPVGRLCDLALGSPLSGHDESGWPLRPWSPRRPGVDFPRPAPVALR